MADGIKVVNSQGTKIYVVASGTDVSDCAKIATALSNGKLIGCPQSLGELSETRNVTEYKCLSSNETVKSLGSISRGSLEIGLLLNPDDTEGQKELKDAFKSNTGVIIMVELPNKPDGGAHGTIYTFDANVSGVSTGIAMDAAVSYTVTLEVSGEITECAAA